MCELSGPGSARQAGRRRRDCITGILDWIFLRLLTMSCSDEELAVTKHGIPAQRCPFQEHESLCTCCVIMYWCHQPLNTGRQLKPVVSLSQKNSHCRSADAAQECQLHSQWNALQLHRGFASSPTLASAAASAPKTTATDPRIADPIGVSCRGMPSPTALLQRYLSPHRNEQTPRSMLTLPALH
jgi:hypothetical protein